MKVNLSEWEVEFRGKKQLMLTHTENTSHQYFGPPGRNKTTSPMITIFIPLNKEAEIFQRKMKTLFFEKYP